MNNFPSILRLLSEHRGKPIRWLDIGKIHATIEDTNLLSAFELETLSGIKEQVFQDSNTIPNEFQPLDLISCIGNPKHQISPEALVYSAKPLLKPQGFLWVQIDLESQVVESGSDEMPVYPLTFWIHCLCEIDPHVAIRCGKDRTVELLVCMQATDEDKNILRAFEQRNRPLKEAIHHSGTNFAWIPETQSTDLPKESVETIYSIQYEKHPVQLSVQIVSNSTNHPDLFLGDRKLIYGETRSEGNANIHVWEPVVVPPGGQTLTLRTADEPFAIQEMHTQSEPYPVEAFLERLPFDHYQRYRMAADIVGHCFSEPVGILDVGGTKGYAHLFLDEHFVNSIDTGADDVVNAMRYSGARLPLTDHAHNVVLSMDTLEHIPEDRRDAFLDELCRVTGDLLIVGGPFDDPSVQDAEDIVRSFAEIELGLRDRFLDEHADYHLPKLDQTQAALERNGFHVMALPNGYLPRWLMMQMTGFALGVAPELADAKAKFYDSYNRQYFRLDNREPSYRTMLLAFRSPISDERRQWLNDYVSVSPPETDAASLDFSSLLVGLSSYRLIREKEHTIDEFGQRNTKLLEHIENQAQQIEREQSERNKLYTHIENLETNLQQSRTHAENLSTQLSERNAQIEKQQSHIQNLDDEAQNRNEHLDRLMEHIQNLEINTRNLETHAQNLTQEIQEKSQAIQGLQTHAENLAAMHNQLDEHNRNLLQHSENLQAQLEAQRAQLEAQRAQLETQRAQLEAQQAQLEQYKREYSETHRVLGECFAILNRSDLPSDEMIRLLENLEQHVNPEFQDALQGILHSMKHLSARWLQERDMLAEEIQTMQSSSGFKILSRLGMMPGTKEPPSS